MKFRLSVALCVSIGFVLASDATDAAAKLAKAAAKAERKGDAARAYALYSQALALEPGNIVYGTRVQEFQSLAKVDPSLKEKEAAAAKEPGIDAGLAGRVTAEDAAEARQPLPPIELDATQGAQDFDLRGDSKSLFQSVAKAFGLLVVFESAYPESSPARFQMAGVDYRAALHALEIATNSFVIPVGDRLLYVVADNPTKRQQYEKTVTVTVPIPETVSDQELQEVANAVKSTMDIQRVMVDKDDHMVLIRDRISKVRPAQALLESLMRPHPQVDLEVDLISVDSSDSLHWGFPLPTSYPLINFGSIARFVAAPAIPTGYSSFMTFGGGATFVGIGVTSATLFATSTESLTTTQYRAHLAASNNMPATLHVGNKYPLVTSTFIGTVANSTVPPPTIQFEDLGFQLKITPHAHGRDEVTLEVEASYTLLGQVNANGIPTLNDRKFQSTVRLREGEWAVVTGLMSGTDARTLGGVAGLAAVPFLGKALADRARSTDRTETMLVIKPRLLNLPPTEFPAPVLMTGTETRPLSML